MTDARALRVAGLVAFVITFVAQIAAFQGELREVATQTFHPAHTDATEYVERARGIVAGDWSLTLETGYRTPGYPLIVALFLATGAGLVGLRVVQCALVSLVPAMLGCAAARLGATRGAAILVIVLGAVFAPMYWFSTWIFAEAPSVALGSALLVVLAGMVAGPARPRRAEVVAGLLVGLATLLKPNQLLLLVPALAAVAVAPERSRRSRATGALVVTLVAAAVVAPWSIAVSRHQDRTVVLSTADGLNLWIGVGGAVSERGSLFGRAAERFGLYDRAEEVAVHEAARAETDASRRSAVFRSAALARAAERPGAVAALGVAKVLHTAGFSLRGIPDYLYALLSLATLVAAARLLRSADARSRRYVVVWAAATAAIAVQALVFLPNYRFRAVFYDPASLVLLALAAPSIATSLGIGRARRTTPPRMRYDRGRTSSAEGAEEIARG